MLYLEIFRDIHSIYVVEVFEDGFVAGRAWRGIVRVDDPCACSSLIVHVYLSFRVFQLGDHRLDGGVVFHAFHIAGLFLREVPDYDTVTIDNDDEGAAVEF